jgi:3-oxoacyl-[acyl-carrier protein] reductase
LIRRSLLEKSLEGVSALVTGAARGIGRAVAVRLAKGGCRVAVADVLEGPLNETAKLVQDQGAEALVVLADVSKQEDVDRMIGEAAAAFGGLDVLVNNAGVSCAGFMDAVADGDIERVFNVNIIGVMRVTRAAAKHIKESGRGRIINVSSVEGTHGSGLVPAYSATKAAVLGLTRSNAIEFARSGATVNAVCPGPIDTDMLAPLLANEKFREKVGKGVPMKRLGKPEDIAAAVAFFASEDSSYITGQHLVIDGGMTVKAL